MKCASLTVPFNKFMAVLPAVKEETLVRIREVSGRSLGWVVAYRPTPQEIRVRNAAFIGGGESQLAPTSAQAKPIAARFVISESPMAKKKVPWASRPEQGGFDVIVSSARDRTQRMLDPDTRTDDRGFWHILCMVMYMHSPNEPLIEKQVTQEWIRREAAFYVRDYLDPLMLFPGVNSGNPISLASPDAWVLFGNAIATRKVVLERGNITRVHASPKKYASLPLIYQAMISDARGVYAQCYNRFSQMMTDWLCSRQMQEVHARLHAERPLCRRDMAVMTEYGFMLGAQMTLFVPSVKLDGDILEALFHAQAVPPCLKGKYTVLNNRLRWLKRKEAPYRSFLLAHLASFYYDEKKWAEYYNRLAKECGQMQDKGKEHENKAEAKQIFRLAAKKPRSCRAMQAADARTKTCTRCPARSTNKCLQIIGVMSEIPKDIEDLTLTPRDIMKMAYMKNKKQ